MSPAGAPRPISLALLLALAAPAAAQVTPDQAAEMLFTAAQRAAAERNYPAAAESYRQFAEKFAGHPRAPAARFGQALALVEGPRDYDKAIPLFAAVAGTAAPEKPYAAYYAGLSRRALGLIDLSQIAAKPNEAPQLRQRADQRFAEASRDFAAAAAAFAAALPKDLPKVAPPEAEWHARALADQAEMELRCNRPKEAMAAAAAFLDGPPSRTPSRGLGLYQFGSAALALQDYLVAGRALGQLQPYDQPGFGLHAGYLMGRVYHLTNSAAEAALRYEAVGPAYEKQKKLAEETLRKPDLLRDQPWEKQRLEALAREAPEFVPAALFHSAVLAYEAGKAADALAAFQAFVRTYPKHPLLLEAQFRAAVCQVPTAPLEAANALRALVGKSEPLSDQILLWLGKALVAQAKAVDPAKPQERDALMRQAADQFRAAAEKANALSGPDPTAKPRRGEALVELAEASLALKDAPGALRTYEQVIAEQALPQRLEELLVRRLEACQLANDFARTDLLCDEFQKKYPQSSLLPPVAFRRAENAYFQALEFEKLNRPDARKAFDDAGARYAQYLKDYPNGDRAAAARYTLALALFKRGDTDEALAALEAMGDAERSGDLAEAAYLYAECLLRGTPLKADDALAAGMMQEKLQKAAGSLSGFIDSSPKSPLLPDALLKLGHCQLRLALEVQQPQERAELLGRTRQTYDKVIAQFANQPSAAVAVFERAKCINAQGDRNGAANELKRFAQDPLLGSPAAPEALMLAATYLRSLNRAEEGAQLLIAARPRIEPSLDKFRERQGAYRFHLGACLQEANKPTEAAAIYESVPQTMPNHPLLPEAFLRSAQCRTLEIVKPLEKLRADLAQPNLKPEQVAPLAAQLSAVLNQLRGHAQQVEVRSDAMKDAFPTSEARGRLNYEAAWAWREVAKTEVAAAREAIAKDRQAKAQAEADKKATPGVPAPRVPPPEVALKDVPQQPAEKRAGEAYAKIVEGWGELPLAVETRFEWAEALALREDVEGAVKLLKTALDKEPAGDTEDRVRLALGLSLALRREWAAAKEQFQVVAARPKSAAYPAALYRLGEALAENGEAEEAVKVLALFRDKGELHNVPGVSDRAVLRLGYAYAALKQWELSRQALEVMVNRYGNSPWVHDGRYGIAWAQQNLNQIDPAVNGYNAVIAGTASELAAKAYIQVGLCRAAQKRYGEAAAAFLIVPYTFDFPDLSAAALYEAAAVMDADAKPEEGRRLRAKLLKDFPKSKWADSVRAKEKTN